MFKHLPAKNILQLFLSLKVSFSHFTTEGDVQVDRIQAAEVLQYCKSMMICNFAHLNKGQTNNNPLG